MAFFSAIIISPNIAKEADTPPVVGSVKTEIKGRLVFEREFTAMTVLGICMSDKIPSCILAPPDELKIISGKLLFLA